MSEKKLVIFDLDGTLLYTVPDIAAATNQALAACGYPVHSEKEIASYIGNGINKLFERALPEEARNKEEVLRIRSLFLPYYNEHCADATRPFDGIPELLATICRCGIQVAVASNKYHPATVKLMQHFFPEIPFCAVFGEREGVPRKPEPVIVWDILREAGIHCPAADGPGRNFSRTEFPRRTPVRPVHRRLRRGHADRRQRRPRGRRRHLGLPHPGGTRLLLPRPHRRQAFSDSGYSILIY